MRGSTRGFLKNHSSSVPEPRPKIALISFPHLPLPLGLRLLGRWATDAFFDDSDY